MQVWRNGRRKGLKIPRGQLHEGSTPSTCTIIKTFCGILSPTGHQLLSEPDREQVAPWLWLKTTHWVVLFTRRPLEGNFMRVRPPPPAPNHLSKMSFFKKTKKHYILR